MLIGKLSGGVLRVLTPLGPHYVRPTFAQRMHLLWIFRNFELLPLQVLSARQQHLIDELCAEPHFVDSRQDSGIEDAPMLGTVERRPPIEIEALPARRPNGRAQAAVAGGLRQRS